MAAASGCERQPIWGWASTTNLLHLRLCPAPVCPSTGSLSQPLTAAAVSAIVNAYFFQTGIELFPCLCQLATSWLCRQTPHPASLPEGLAARGSEEGKPGLLARLGSWPRRMTQLACRDWWMGQLTGVCREANYPVPDRTDLCPSPLLGSAFLIELSQLSLMSLIQAEKYPNFSSLGNF